ncbi:disulfide bond formation protein DsbB [Alphaproteobacteria bacterium]|nr:disulfide bond formation protein DsbB [Alphaproteobacteria bacterium]
MGTVHRNALFVLFACIAALATALIAQYGFGYRPCILCTYQRIPYVVSAVLAVLSFLPSKALPRFLLRLAGLAFVVNAGIAAYHVGVEHLWWAGPDGCRAGLALLPDSPEELMKALGGPLPVRCEDVQLQFMGVSLAGGNLAASVLLALYVFVSTRPSRCGG